MSLKTYAAKIFAKHIHKKIQNWSKNPIKTQEKVLQNLLKKAKHTLFGIDHAFSTISNYTEFKTNVPIRDYEGLKNYVEEIKKGKLDVLWPGKPIYFAKTSGTTSGTKYIPISKESIKNQIELIQGFDHTNL